MTFVNSLRSFWHSIAKPPYVWVPVAACLYVLILGIIYPYNGPFTGHLIGFDDRTRMVQVLNFINGNGWYDRTIMRVNAPEGFESIWSRIVDLPIALVVVIGQCFTDQKTAALAATVIVPLAELMLLFFAARYAVRPLVGKNESWLIVLFVMMTSVLNQQTYTFSGFYLGEASHHPWYIILNVLMMGACVRIASGEPDTKADMWLAVAIGLFLAVGIEGFPLIAGAVAILGMIAWAFHDSRLAGRSARAVGGGALLGLIVLPMHQPPQHLFDVLFSQPSILGPILIGTAAAFLFLEKLVLHKIGQRKTLSLFALGLCAALCTAFLIVCFPQILDGATAGLSPEERRMAASEHPETWTMWHATLSLSQYIGLAAPSLFAILAGILAAATTSDRQTKIRFITYASFAGLSFGLTQIFWRYIHHAMVAACPLLLWLWQKIREKLSQGLSCQNARRLFAKRLIYFAASLAVYIILCPFWMVALPALEVPTPFWPQVLAFPAKLYLEPYRCDITDFARYLDAHYDDQTTINVQDSQSAYYLYHTHLKVDFLANFPSHNHFIDNKNFFNTQNLDDAKGIARRHGFDLVALCKITPMSAGLIFTRKIRKPMLFETLLEGHPPEWLKPVPMDIETDYLLYQIDKTGM